MSEKDKITIVEVGPRDGLQNVEQTVSLTDKFKFIDLLSACGLSEIEAGAFVNPKLVPQMADSDKIFAHLKLKGNPHVIYSALVPNERGMEAAVRAGVKKIAVFTAASETFNQKNINCSTAASIQHFKAVLTLAKKEKIATRAYVSTAFVCPYEGEIQTAQVVAVVQQLVDHGLNEISVGDTIGKATPYLVERLLEKLLKQFPKTLFAMHFHNTYGNAIRNVETSLNFGITHFDSSAGGIGGCPFAPTASGNVSTDELVYFFRDRGFTTGVDVTRLEEASRFIRGVLKKY